MHEREDQDLGDKASELLSENNNVTCYWLLDPNYVFAQTSTLPKSLNLSLHVHY